MGAVYLAFDNTLEHEVAVKSNLNPSESATAQFLREARLLAKLRHPNLPRVNDHFVEQDQQFLVMDYIPGDDLGKLLEKQNRLPLETVINFARQLGDALTYLHNQDPQVIHRDIKPANIKLMTADQVILVDFGIAKATSAAQVTSTGATGYTPGYAPPEQYGGA
ncbi:MAG: serine/threonine-protein kinase, partial [Leptolinea sp.]